ncbi:MAG: UDP-N-acetylmuramoyl-tripeptide--D-alanyl-D-alanine ligase [Coriobacteriales bacterium]|nr:UDP-N-acetylmuramoyl-tripeptide--D-alanyl-D-alanine ligase [Coriobacteriales bacterium]
MIRMTIEDAIRATDCELVAGDPQGFFEGVSIDSRSVPAGGAFVAFAGERVDGNRFAAQALRTGAAVVVLTAPADQETLEAAEQTGGAVLRAKDDDGEQFMLALAEAWRARNPQWIVVGVTGSVGKTTTKEMLAAGIGAHRRVHATKGNFNNLLGVPLTLFAASSEDEVLVVEMGMNNAGEISRIAAAARPNVAVITNIGTSHIGNLGSREGIARAKAEVVGGLTGCDACEPTLVLANGDDFSDFIQNAFAEPAGVRVLRVGGADSAIYAASVDLNDDGLPSVVVRTDAEEELRGTLLLPGRAMVLDLLIALGAIKALGLSCEPALRAICGMRPARMRMEVRQEGSSARVIDDTYNASPSSMAAALDVLCSMRCDGRRVAVLGQIGELGDESARLHALVGAYAAAKPLDMLVLIGTGDIRHMADAALTMGFSEDKLERFDTVDEAVRVIAPLLRPEDLVLAKASRAAELDMFTRGVLDA